MFNPFDFNFTHAIVTRVPNSIKEATVPNRNILATFQSGRLEAIDPVKAKEFHNEYILTLRKLGVDVIELPPDETLPDSTFIDCLAVICNGLALLGRPHITSRKKEVDIVKAVLRKEGLSVIDMKDPFATLDASDVFFTGREFFVATSKRTNDSGARAVATAFPDFPVSLIKLKKGSFHLKAYVSVAGPDILAIGSSETAHDVLRQMKELSEYKKYQVITVPDLKGVNCLYVNGSLLHCAIEEMPNSAKLFASKIDYPRVELKNKEFSKVDRFLTCRSLLFTKRKLFAILSSSYFTNIAMLLNPNKLVEEENIEKTQPQSQPIQPVTPKLPISAPPNKTISLALPAHLNNLITTPFFSSLANRKNSAGQKA